MDFGLFFAHALPRPWSATSEADLFREGLDQMELADRLGYSYAWVVEQHFLEEYSHSSAPEVFLAAASQRTEQIRLGHGIVLMPPGYNQPARVAERIATLDLVSNGRAELGFGDSKSRMELEGFGIEPAERRAMTLEAVEQVADMLTLEPYPGHHGAYFSMPPRNVVPKPVQQPHPRLWVACSDDATIHLAAQLGVGVLAHTFFDADEAEHIVTDYYETFKRECVPIGHNVNPNVFMIAPLYCHPDEDEARRVGMEAHGFTTYAARHYYAFGRHRPGRTSVSDDAQKVRAEFGGEIPWRGANAVGTPEQIAARLRTFQDVGVDQVVLQHRAGRMPHDVACASLELFAADVMPQFSAEHEERQRRKQEELAPYIEAALACKPHRAPLADDEIPLVDAYGLSRPDVELAMLDGQPESTRELILELNRMKQIAMRLTQ